MNNTWTALAILGVLVAACDERPAIPPVVPPLPAPAATLPAEPVAPTTQALLSGPRKTLPLDVVPLSLDVPAEGWTLETIAGITVVNGYSPSGPVTIQLNQRSVQRDSIPLIEQGAKDQVKADSSTYLLAEGRDLNGLAIFERQWFGRERSGDEPRTRRWTVTAYVPRNETTSSVYELNFVGLTETQFQADRNFLYSIVDSLKLDKDRAAAKK